MPLTFQFTVYSDNGTDVQFVYFQSSYVYRVAKTHRIPYLYRSFSAKVTNIQWLFCGK